MSRILKFRAWDKVEGHYWNDLLNIGTGGRPEFSCADEYFDCDEFIIEQYTGLKDKNGVEIYEGDIVKTTDRVTVKGLIFPIGVVEFKQQAFWICNVPSERPDFTHNEALLRYWETDLEVIGNIHQNGKLVGEVDDEA